MRNIIQHSVPYLLTVFTVFTSDLMFLESDWWIILLTGVFYIIVNYSISEYADSTAVYFMDWSVVS